MNTGTPAAAGPAAGGGPDDTVACARGLPRPLINVPGPAQVVAEMVRLARPGGRVVAMEPDTEYALCYLPTRPSPGCARPSRWPSGATAPTRSITQVRARLSQDSQPRIETIFSIGDLTGASETTTWIAPTCPEAGAAFEACPRALPPRQIFPVELAYQLELHLEPESLAAVHGTPRGLGQMRGWLNLPHGQAFDPVSLLLAADALPPATADVQLTGQVPWVPTLELSTYVRALPAPGPMQVHLAAGLLHGNRVDQTCTIRDCAGTVVVQSHQLAAIRLCAG